MRKKPDKGIKRNGSLAKTLSTKSGITVFICLLVIGAILLFMVGSSVKSLLDNSFMQITETDAAKIQEKISLSESDNELISDYVNANYDQIAAKSYNAGEASSIIEGTLLTAGAKELENHLSGLVQSIVNNNPMVEGMGVFFEPYSIDPNIEHLGFYVLQKDGDKTETLFTDVPWTRQYYADTVKTGKSTVTSPYVDSFKHNVFTISTPIKVDGKTIGIIISDLMLDEYANIDFKHQNKESFVVALINQNDEIMFHSAAENVIGKAFSQRVESEEVYKAIQGEMKNGEAFRVSILATDKEGKEAFFSPIEVAGQKWWVYTAVDTNDFYSDMNRLIVVTVILLVLAVIVLVITMLLQIRKSLKPLEELDVAGQALKQGNLGYKLEYAGNNEIGRICVSVQAAFSNLESVIGEISTAMKALSEGDLTYMPTQEYVGDFKEIRASYLKLLQGLNDGFRKIKLSATQISDGADQVSQGAQSLSQSSMQQAASVEELSATIGDIAGKINLNAKSADEANALSDQIGDAIEISNGHMNDLMDAMERMTNASSEVNKIIKTIDDIAFQTNILALNAAVEAARAGAAGKGFAVVADEVRNLASKSATAAKSTTELIETSINAVAEGKEIAEKTAQSLELVVQNANTITSKIKEILSSSEEQAVSASQINLGADQISSAVQTNSATSEESAAASEELASQAGILDSLIAQYKLIDDSTSILEEQTSVAETTTTESKESKVNLEPKVNIETKVNTEPKINSVSKADKKSKDILQPGAVKEIEATSKPKLTKELKPALKQETVKELNKADTQEDDKTAEIVTYESKAHDISQVKELHSDASEPQAQTAPKIAKTEHVANKNTSHTEISDFDNKYF